MAAFVLGNGRSRESIDVNYLLTQGPVYGCNALYRTHTPTVLVATDTPISEKIQATGYALKNRFYTRRPTPDLGGLPVPRLYHGFSSGPIAVAIAAQDNNSLIYLLGFDMGPTEAGRFNNVYADTEFYKKTESLPTFTGNWVKQLKQIITENQNTKFIRVYGATTAAIPDLEDIPNLGRMTINDFLASLNKAKDL